MELITLVTPPPPAKEGDYWLSLTVSLSYWSVELMPTCRLAQSFLSVSGVPAMAALDSLSLFTGLGLQAGKSAKRSRTRF